MPSEPLKVQFSKVEVDVGKMEFAVCVECSGLIWNAPKHEEWHLKMQFPKLITPNGSQPT